jgi:serine/threonine protein kinase
MECHMTQCNKLADAREFCSHCGVVYCSEVCRKGDWMDAHQYECTEYISFKLQDLTEVTDPSLRILGKGSYGEVKLYKHKTTAALYAIKTINKEFIRKHSSLSVLLREITIHKNLRHPNIIQLIKYFEDPEKVQIVLEYASKESLFRTIRKKKKLDEPQAWKYFTETCLGIKYLHDNEIIHRDLKPENILIDKYDHVKICDFGWCVQSNEVRNTFCGTLEYMAPEMLLGEGHSYQVDLWALGVLLYELIHGYAPFRAVKEVDKRQQIIYNDIEFGRGVSLLAKDLIQKLLKKNPKERINIDKILSHPWVAKYTNQHELQVGMKINHPVYETGEILQVTGMIAKVKFRDNIFMITIPDILPMIEIIEPPRVTISVMEKEVFEQLEKWCLAPTGFKKGLIDLHKSSFEFNKQIDEFNSKIKRKGSIDGFEEIVERASLKPDNYLMKSSKSDINSPNISKPENSIIKSEKFVIKSPNPSVKSENSNAKSAKISVKSEDFIIKSENSAIKSKKSSIVKPENSIPNGSIKDNINEIQSDLKFQINYSENFGGLFDNQEVKTLIDKRLKNIKKRENVFTSSVKIPNDKELFTKDSTAFQKTFDVKHRIDISDEAFQIKKEELDKIRKTLESNTIKKAPKKEKRGFFSNLFGCIDRN